MSQRHRFIMFSVVVAVVSPVLACAGAPPHRPVPAVALEVTTRGEPIYVGRVFPLEADTTTPTFVYERRVDERDGSLTSTHVTRDLAGNLVLAESATHSKDYRLASYTLHANQLGQTGEIRVANGQVHFRLRDGAETREAVEKTTRPVVVGPTLVGHVIRHLPSLRRGRMSSVRFAVLDRLETIGFELEAAPSERGSTKIVMTPSSFVYGLAIDPVTFTFDARTNQLVRLEGRVPTKRPDGDRLADFDARVEYRFLAPSYR